MTHRGIAPNALCDSILHHENKWNKDSSGSAFREALQDKTGKSRFRDLQKRLDDRLLQTLQGVYEKYGVPPEGADPKGYDPGFQQGLIKAFDDSGGLDLRYMWVAEDISSRLTRNETLEVPIDMDGSYIDNVNATGKPIWGERHICMILDHLDEIHPGHGLTRADFPKEPGEGLA